MREAIRKELTAAALAVVPSAMAENQVFKGKPGEAFRRLAILFGEPQRMELAGEAKRMAGRLIVQVFEPAESGTKNVTTLADLLAAAFEFKQRRFEGIVLTFGGAEIVTVGKRDGFQQWNVATPWSAESY